jgi:type IV pilus assembly protein PilQ
VRLTGALAALRSDGKQRMLSPRGSVIFEPRTNQLFVQDIPSKLEEVQALIAKIDIPVRQVLIEARIVEADDSFGRKRWASSSAAPTCAASGTGGIRQPAASDNYATGRAETRARTPGRPAPGGSARTSQHQFVNLPANGDRRLQSGDLRADAVQRQPTAS